MTFLTQPAIDAKDEADRLKNEQTTKYKMRVSALQMISRKRIKSTKVFIWPVVYFLFILIIYMHNTGVFGKPSWVMYSWQMGVMFAVATWAMVWVAVRDAVTMAIHTAVRFEGKPTEVLFTVVGVEKTTPFTRGNVVIALKDPCGAVHHLKSKIDPEKAMEVEPGQDCDNLEQIHPFMANQLREKWEPALHNLEK